MTNDGAVYVTDMNIMGGVLSITGNGTAIYNNNDNLAESNFLVSNHYIKDAENKVTENCFTDLKFSGLVNIDGTSNYIDRAGENVEADKSNIACHNITATELLKASNILNINDALLIKPASDPTIINITSVVLSNLNGFAKITVNCDANVSTATTVQAELRYKVQKPAQYVIYDDQGNPTITTVTTVTSQVVNVTIPANSSSGSYNSFISYSNAILSIFTPVGGREKPVTNGISSLLTLNVSILGYISPNVLPLI